MAPPAPGHVPGPLFLAEPPRLKIRDIIGEPLVNCGVTSGRELAARVAELALKVGLREDALDRYPRIQGVFTLDPDNADAMAFPAAVPEVRQRTVPGNITLPRDCFDATPTAPETAPPFVLARLRRLSPRSD